MKYFFDFLQWLSAIGEIFICYSFISIIVKNKLIMASKPYICFCSLVIGTLLAINRGKDGSLLSWFMLLFQSMLIFFSLLKKENDEKEFCFYVIIAYNVCLAFLQLLFAFGMLAFFYTENIKTIYFKSGVYKSFCCILSLFVIIIIYILVSYYAKSNMSSLEPYKRTFLLYDVAGICLIAGLQEHLLLYGENRSKSNLFFIIMIIGASFLMLMGSFRSAEKRTELEMLEFRNKLLEENYKEIRNMYQNYAYTYHDMKNHLIILANYCKSGDIEKAILYMEKIQEPIQQVKYYIKSGDDIMDIILNYKLSQAEKNGIHTEVIMDITDKIGLQENDLCAIFSNLLDNAIQACNYMEGGEKWIRVLIKRIGDILLINVMNSYTNAYKEEQTQTLKKELHGYGLESVKAKVKKYDGDIKLREKDGTFIVTITFFDIREN